MSSTEPTPPSSAISDAQSPLYGRDQELATLVAALDAAQQSSSATLIVGEAGVGKTRLLKTTSAMARDRGFRVLATEGLDFEAGMDHAALHKLLLPLRETLSTLTRPQRMALEVMLGIDTHPVADRLFAHEAVLSLLTRAAADQPILMTVDDLDLIDDSTLSVLSFVARRLDHTRIGIISAISDESDGRYTPLGHRVPLHRLSHADAERLLRHIEPGLPPNLRQLVLDQSDGNPLVLLELLPFVRRALQDPSTTVPFVLPLPPRSTRSFKPRIERLPSSTQRAMLLLALDQRGDITTLRSAGSDIIELDDAERSGLISIDLGSLTARFEHPMIRSALVAGASAGERRLAHLVLAESPGRSLEERAFHLAEAASGTDEPTAALLEEAASSALSRGDSAVAAHAMARAARLSPESNDRRRRMGRAAYLAADSLGTSNARRDFNSRPAHGASWKGSMHLSVAAAFAWLNGGGDVGTACRMVRDAVHTTPHSWDAQDSELLDALNAWVVMCWTSGRADAWQELNDALALLKPAIPKRLRTLSAALSDTLGSGSTLRSEVAELLADLSGEDESSHAIQLGTAAIFFDLLPEARAGVLRVVEHGRLDGYTVTSLRALVLMALCDFDAGRWDHAQQLLDEGLEHEDAVRLTPLFGMLCYIAALLAAARGDARDAESWARQLDDTAKRIDAPGLRRFGLHAHTLLAGGQQDWEGAYHHATALTASGVFDPLAPHAIRVAYDLVEAALRTGRTGEAHAHYAAMVRVGLANLSPRLAMLTSAAAGLIADTEGWQDEFESALAVPNANSWPFDYARVQLAFGSRLRRVRHPIEARAQLHRALTTFERLGARPWVLRTRSEIRAAGEQVATGSSPASSTDVSTLTAQERVVAELAAEGFSNKQIAERLFLSPRTVSGHLYRIFPKMGIVSRSALRDALEARETTSA